MADSLFNPEHLMAVLDNLAKDVKEVYVEQLRQHDRFASGELMASIRTEVRVNGTTYEVVLTLQDYWKYVEEGTAGRLTGNPSRKLPNIDAIKRWVIIKPVVPRPLKNGALPKPAQLAWAIASKIRDYGTKGTHDLQNAKESVLPWYTEQLKEALQRDAMDYIERVRA